MPDRVLVVEDNLGTQALVKRMLVRMDASLDIRCSSTAEEAFEVLTRAREAGKPFDFAIVDLNLPGGIDGLTLRNLAQVRQPDLDYLFISGTSYEKWCERILHEADWPAFLKKPFSEEELRRFWREHFQTSGTFAG